MIGPSTEKVMSVASGPLGAAAKFDLPDGRVFGELAELLDQRNGFYAFEAALHVFGAGSGVVGGSIETWNSDGLWRTAYGGLAEGFHFFAEDIFGAQFAVRGNEVFTFDPETAETVRIASSIEDWAEQVAGNYRTLTGFPIAHAWQQANGAIEPGCRLVPKRPFVLGGDFTVANVYMLDSVEGMRVRGELALQIRDLPDGTKIRYRIVDRDGPPGS